MSLVAHSDWKNRLDQTEAQRAHQDIGNKRSDHLAKCRADNNADCQINNVTSKGEFFKFINHDLNCTIYSILQYLAISSNIKKDLEKFGKI